MGNVGLIPTILALCLLLGCQPVFGNALSDQPMWTWLSGNVIAEQRAVYGSKGVASTNNVPGARYGAVGWFDAINKELWLFGGYGYTSTSIGLLNDLWRYRVNDSTWTRISGSNTTNQLGVYADTSNSIFMPGARSAAVGWYNDVKRELWLFGGKGYGSSDALGYLNDMWRFDVETLSWAWMYGSDTPNQEGVYDTKFVPLPNIGPGGRDSAVGIFDSAAQEAWLFGGRGFANGTNVGLLNDLWKFSLDTLTWTWMSGASELNQPDVRSEKGVFDPAYQPGARLDAVGWFDSVSQELWIFGGIGYGSDITQYGNLNELWRYQVNTSSWAWMSGSDYVNQKGIYGEKGQANSSNVPGGRYGSIGWFDSSTQEIWLFGGRGFSHDKYGILNDFWRYSVSDSTWTWISGSNDVQHPGVCSDKGDSSTANVPSARHYAIGGYDNVAQQFWLFGGNGDDITRKDFLNDLWRYRVNDSTWTWVSGNNIKAQTGVYSEKGVAKNENVPGARQRAMGCYEHAKRELWLFGGMGFDNGSISRTQGLLNDLWRYNGTDSTWTWVSGSNIADEKAVYGVKGVANVTNMPSARYGAVGWYDSTLQELWVFGGYGYDHTSNYGMLNDLWKYAIKASTWTWVSGSNILQHAGIRGEIGTGSTDYVPSARYGAVGLYDSIRQEFWLFGGYAVDAGGRPGYINDLWRYHVNDSTWTWLSGNSTRNMPGIYGRQNDYSKNYQPSARADAVGWFDSVSQELWIFGGLGINIAGDDIGNLNDLWKYRVVDSTWAWISGSVNRNQPGEYGEKGQANSSNVPGGRYGSIGWFDSSTQELWLFGGQGLDSVNTDGVLNDLWRYRINDSVWTWVAGSNLAYQLDVYGENGHASTDNVPSARYLAVGWHDTSNQELWLFGGLGINNELNDLWKASWRVECPPLHQNINNTCVPLIQCSNSAECSLECDASLNSTSIEESTCLIDGDITVNGTISEFATITIVGVINVTGDVTVVGDVTLKLSPGASLHVGNCLTLEDGSSVIVIVDEESNNGAVLATYNATCSSPHLADLVNIEITPSLDECQRGRPIVEQREEDTGKAQLQLLFVSSSECDTSQSNLLAISIAVPIAVLVVLTILVVLAVPKVREKVFPFMKRSNADKH